MNRPPRSSPLAPISGNSAAKSSPTSNKVGVEAALFMDRRFDLYDNEATENVTYDLPDAHSSDSSYDLRILEEMRAQRETQYARRRQFAKTAENTPGRTPGRFTPGISQRLTANQPRQFVRLAQIESEKEDNDTLTYQPTRQHDQGPMLTRFLRHMPIEKDSHITITRPVTWKPEIHEEFLQAAEDSPLSRKSSARGTPATSQSRKQTSMNRSDSWDLTGDLKDQLGFTSTPAPYKVRTIRNFDVSDGDDETEDFTRSLNLARQKEKSPEQNLIPKASDLRTDFQTQLENLPVNNSQTPWKTQPKVVDSMDVLKRLSRSVSKTPSPKNESASEIKRATYSSRSNSKPNLDNSESKFASALESHPGESTSLLPNSPEKTSTASAKSTKEFISLKSPKRTDSSKSQPSNLSKRSSSIIPDTPLVAGAFISTPGTVKPRPVKEEELEVKPVAKLVETKPSSVAESSMLPKSAISSIVQRAKNTTSESLDEVMGDTTIHSLEDLMEVTSDENVTTDSITDTINLPEGISANPESSAALRQLLEHKLASELPFSQGLPPDIEEQRLIREIVEQRLSRTMRSQVRELRSTHKKREEQKKEATKESENSFWPSLSILTPRKKGRMEEELQLQRMSEHVNTMSSRTRDLKAHMSRLEKKLIHSPVDKPITRRALIMKRVTNVFWEKGQLTWFGLTLLISMMWLVAEMILCFIKCEPLYASIMENNYGPFIEGTRPPFVLVQTVCDPVSWIFAPTSASWITKSVTWLGRFIWHLWTDEYTETQRPRTSRTVMAYAGEATGLGDWSMDADEAI